MLKNTKGALLALTAAILMLACTPKGLATGAGSLTTDMPGGNKTPPQTIYKTPNLKGAVPTNGWESSVLFKQYSDPLYVHPLTFCCTDRGVEVGLPVLSTDGPAVYGLHEADFTVRHEQVLTFDDARADRITDWSVDIVMAAADGSLTATLAKGSPFSWYRFKGGNPLIELYGDPEVTESAAGEQCLRVAIDGKQYGFFAPAGAVWSGIGTRSLTCVLPPGKDYLAVALLPDDTDATLEFFRSRAYALVTDTRAEWAFDEVSGTVTTTFSWVLENLEGDSPSTIMLLYPHQWRGNDSVAFLPFGYDTIRGNMKAADGNYFTVTSRFNGILPFLPDRITNPEAMVPLLADMTGGSYSSGRDDTYWVGKLLGKLAHALPAAEQFSGNEESAVILNGMKTILEDWFTAGEKERGHYFYHDTNWGTLIGYPASYGTDEKLNDHHFHYGYFIYAAAQIALRDPEWGADKRFGSMVKLLIADIASPERGGRDFPYLRNFDPYEGHSWASGDADYFEGNNQESSSESINAWQAIILWGEATGDKNLRDLGIYLYCTETEAINNYWFDIYGDIFPEGYNHVYAALVRGGKYGHEIWWKDTNAVIHGINLLPVSGGSFYLGRDPAYVKANYEEILAESAGRLPPGWKDIIIMYYALHDPAAALALWSPSIQPESGESRAHNYHWLAGLDAMGLPDPTVTADTTLYGVFTKNGSRTWIAFNPGSGEKVISFSDGTSLTIPGDTWAVKDTGGEVTYNRFEDLMAR
jgi:endoglucanase Acf2